MKKILISAFVLLAVAVCVPQNAAAQTAAVPADGLYREEGIASFYGAEFNGRPTASGEIFDSSKLTAAHPTLPFGTLLIVTNTHNNRKISVKVNDRGPFIKSRIIDVSQAAAVQLDMIETGTAPVIIEEIPTGLSVTTPVRPAAPVVMTAPAPAVPDTASPVPVEATLPQLPPAAPPVQTTPVRPVQTTVQMAGEPAPAAVGAVPPAMVTVYPPVPLPQEQVPLIPPPQVPQVQIPQVVQQPAVPATIPQAAPLAVPAAPVPAAAIPPAAIPAAAVPAAEAAPARTVKLLPALTPQPDKTYKLQVGSYKIANNAINTLVKLREAGLNPSYEKYETPDPSTPGGAAIQYYRVVLTGIKGNEVQAAAEKILSAGFTEAVIRQE